ncbi:MurR/RpiR family transcriptional regulator [Alkalimonas collagenimarina]|uniref:MurR/RpiR family transcriptional regulator n=1 Tax=Alkalimonas collagenimarina TaxID=400390 RepID=A0ABT9GZ35_9GAMM|nr:MurR/RpiR family transcriptional regulator [Alkalimonas collagenimarina]MDP4536317.1 MurR/RpiR family transcriptional regulator [Alkalimonas collagenimarina]
MSILHKINVLRDLFSPGEKLLADFILSNPDQIRYMSSRTLAETAGVSQASVVKFTQKLGNKGYTDFKFDLNDSLHQDNEKPSVQLHGQISLDDSFDVTADKLVASKISVLHNTRAINSQQTFEQVCHKLLNAKRIMLCGIGASALVARDLTLKLQKLGMAAITESDTHVQLANVANYSQHDLLFVISESGETPEIIATAKHARANQVQLISLTGYGSNSISRLADVCLHTVADETSARISSILARTAQELVIDTLFILLTQSSDKGRKMLEASNKALLDFRAAAK